MTSVIEVLEAVEVANRQRAARSERSDKYKRFYSSRVWRASRYQWLLKQPRPLRCACCGATSRDTRLAVDHIVPIKKDFSRRLDPLNYQLLCASGALACNLAKGSSDETDWRTKEQTNDGRRSR
jgi:5-methylcytosine-specific restriction endonuclease McrA